MIPTSGLSVMTAGEGGERGWRGGEGEGQGGVKGKKREGCKREGKRRMKERAEGKQGGCVCVIECYKATIQHNHKHMLWPHRLQCKQDKIHVCECSVNSTASNNSKQHNNTMCTSSLVAPPNISIYTPF